jgi:DNA-binding NtrC family response regulator
MKASTEALTSHQSLAILIVDDEVSICEGLKAFLLPSGFDVHITNKSVFALQLFKDHHFDIAILDLMMPELDGIALLREIKNCSPETEAIMISGYGDIQNVIEAMRLGAIDFFQKPFKLQDIQRVIENTLRFRKLKTELQEVNAKYQYLSEELNIRHGKQIIGQNSGIKKIIKLMSKVAEVETTSVLITGESGTGKELIAHGIHLLSSRKDKVFLAINCSSISDTLFESEFFGHTKGSFTGAIENRLGYFETANKGTLFLDEIGDLKLQHQATLLRALEDRKITRIGSVKEIGFDVRIIAATNQNIEGLMAENKFRRDFYHRINSFVIHVPPLRERKEDIPLLLEFFIRDLSSKLNKKVTGFDKSITDLLSDYDFPGNIRELRNMVERAIILSDCSTLNPHHFPKFKTEEKKQSAEFNNAPFSFDLYKNEKELILAALREAGNNKNLAARLLNISWQSLDRRLTKFGLNL